MSFVKSEEPPYDFSLLFKIQMINSKEGKNEFTLFVIFKKHLIMYGIYYTFRNITFYNIIGIMYNFSLHSRF